MYFSSMRVTAGHRIYCFALGMLILSVGLGSCGSASETWRGEEQGPSFAEASEDGPSFAKASEDKPSFAEASEGRQDAETRQMVERLQELVRTGNPMHHYHWNAKLAEMFRSKLEQTGHQDMLWYAYCEQLLNSGDSQRCIDEIEGFIENEGLSLEEYIKQGGQPVVELLALAYLRLGEQENCQNNHTPSSCILPLREEGFHQLTTGSEKALELYSILYKIVPSDKTRWLMNIAHMTLGQYPDQVPEDQLINIPSDRLESTEFPRFNDIAGAVGLGVDGLCGGVCLEDFNNDGFIDVFATSYGMEDQVQLFLHDGKGGYDNVTMQAGLSGIVSGLNCLHADYDNNGNTDILILRGGWLGKGGEHPNSLLRNNGDGTFSDVTESAGMLSFHPTQTAAWADVNRDGFLDLFVGNESTERPHPCELFINNGDGSFSEKAEEYGLGGLTVFAKGTSFGDIDNDGWPDLYLSALGGNNRLFHNIEGHFEDIAESAGVQEPKYSFPCWFWDVNNDGLDDIFVSGYDTRYLDDLARDYAREVQGKSVPTEKPRLYINQGDGTFSEESQAYGLRRTMYSMGASFGDLDNDGFLDMYVGTGAPHFSTLVPNRMFHNLAGEGFEEVTSVGGFGHIQKGHGIGFADMDNDGDQDIYAVMGGAFEGDNFTNVLFENPIQENSWLVLELVGEKSNKSAIGTKLEIILDSGQRIFRTVGTGGSFGASSLQAEIGLAQANRIDTLIVNWQLSERQVFVGLSANSKYRLEEGQSPELVEYEAKPWIKQEGHHHHHH